MAVAPVELVHFWASDFDWPGYPAPDDLPSKIRVGEAAYSLVHAPAYTEETFLFGQGHPARSAMDSSPDSYWYTGDRTESATSGFFGTTYYKVPAREPDTPVTLRFYADNVFFGPTWPEDLMPPHLNVRVAPDFTQAQVYLEPIGDGVYMGELPDQYPTPYPGEDHHFQVQVGWPSQFGVYLRMHLFHIQAEFTPPIGPGPGGHYRLRQRQTLTAADSWPLRQRHNGSHSGSWPLRQRQTGI